VRSGDVDEVHKDVRRRPGGRSARVRAAVLQAALDAMAKEWNRLTDEFGRAKQLAAYRAAMGLPPKN